MLAPVRNERLVVTTDAIVEGVHFSCAYSSPADIGHRALAVNLSDLAAMGATPRWALLSLVLPGSWPVADVETLVDGVAELARRYSVAVVGGNISRTDGPLVVDITTGGGAMPRRWMTRSGARPGDEIWLSGTIGGAAAGLEMMSEPGAGSPDPVCAAKHRRPEPRVRLGLAMARARVARAAMDLSDGLSDALRQVASASGVGVRIEAESLPIEPGAREWWTSRGENAVQRAMAGSDDYELVFAVPPRSGRALRAVARHITEPALTKIGVFTKDPHERVVVHGEKEEALPAGFEHFAESR